MDPERRRQVRSARTRRRAGRQDDGGDASGAASSAATPRPRDGGRSPPPGPTAAAATAGASNRRAAKAVRDEAQRLSQRMQQQRQDRTRADQLLSQREALIQDRYAPGTAAGPLPRGATHHQQQQAAAAALAAAANFDKDELLSELIGDNKANFLKLDHDLTEDHSIATQRLHSSVFAHANSFLLLFRDVDRASDLVEALKANVQGTKAAISSISKYSSASLVTASSGGVGGRAAGAAGAGDGRGSVFGSALSSSVGEGDPRRLSRPSLVTRRITQRYTSGGPGGGGEEAWLTSTESTAGTRATGPAATAAGAAATKATTWASTMQRGGVEGSGADGGAAVSAMAADDGGGAADVAGVNTGASRPTTRGLNVSSVRQWRYTIGLSSTSPATTAAAVASASSADRAEARGGGRRPGGGGRPGGSGAAAPTAGATAEKEAMETLNFVEIVREEVSQLLTERRHVDAAELLYRLADEATKKGCLPFLLDLEAALVGSVISNVVRIPVTPMFVESLHIPLVQLLLRFGRSRSAAAVYLAMQTPWLHSEVQKLQSRVNPQYASLIAVDYLVRVTRATVRRQHTLGLELESAKPFMADTAALGSTAATSSAKEDAKRKAAAAGRAGGGGKAPAGGPASAGKLIPPNSAALLWVRRNVERFACDVLATHLLSFGTGTDGGDPTRIRQAAQMIAQTSRVMQVLSADGFAGCDTLILRQLTPSLVILEDDFTRLTGEQMHHGGRAMVEQLIMASLMFYETHEANTKAVNAAAEATAAYAAAVEKYANAAAASAATAAAAAGDVKQSGAAAAAASAAGLSGQKMPVPPAPPRISTPYIPSKCDDVARKVRARCQELVQVLRTLPLSGHSLLIQLLLSPASSSLFQATGAGAAAASSPPASVTARRVQPSAAANVRAASRSAALPPGKLPAPSALTALLFSAVPPPPPLSAEVYRFLRYANGCSSTQIRLLQSLFGYVAALTGTANLPAEVMASAAAQEAESANSTAAAAMRAQQMECVAYLLTSAMVTESIDVVLSNLFTTMLLSLLKQRRALVRFLSSDVFLAHHRSVFPPPAASKAAAVSDRPFFSDPVNAPAWVLDGALSLLSDVLGMGVWISYFTRGGAMAHMLADAEFNFRTQHLERVRREVPRLVQGWMAATLLLGSDVTHASAVLAPQKRATTAAATAATPRAAGAATPLLAPQQSVLFGSRAPERGGVASSPTAGAASPTAAAANRIVSNMSFTAVAAAATAAAAQATSSPSHRDARDGVEAASVLLAIPVTSGSGAPGEAAASDASAASTPAFFAESGVREERLLKLIMTLLDRKYRTPANFTVHRYVIDSATTVDSSTGGPCGVWAVRRRLSSYPEFPIGDMWEHRKDEVFLFHWCVQISLHLLTFFQERLVTPSATMNQRAAEAQGGAATFLANGLPFPLKGCITPQEDTVLAGLCAGGGNYVTALALLQFLVMRLLRDGLCRAETWSAVYDCPVAQWRADEGVLRQQLFFFSLFLSLWSPLFTGGRAARPRGGGGAAGAARPTAAAAAAAAGAAGGAEDAAVSSYMVDGLPPLAVVEWMTCGGVLSPGADAAFVDAATAAATPDTIPASLTAIDVLFGTEGTIYLSDAGRDKSGAAGANRSTGGGGGGAASWKAKAGGAGTPAVGASGVTVNAAGVSAQMVLAKRDLFGAGASFVPDSLLRVVRRFFEEQLGESRAIPAITSDMMRNRVEKAMADINLAEFVGTSLGADDDDDESDTASVSSATSASASAGGSPTPAQKTTLLHLRELIAAYTRPVV